MDYICYTFLYLRLLKKVSALFIVCWKSEHYSIFKKGISGFFNTLSVGKLLHININNISLEQINIKLVNNKVAYDIGHTFLSNCLLVLLRIYIVNDRRCRAA